MAVYVDAAGLAALQEGMGALLEPHLHESAGKDHRVLLSLISLLDT